MLVNLFIIACGGALGAMARFLSVITAQAMLGTRFPYGTLLVNSIGSLLAGMLMIVLLNRFTNDGWRLFLMVGFLGAFTTFSSFTWETWSLVENGSYNLAWFNILLNNSCSLLLAFLGIHIGRWLGGGF